ncbi:MAG: hypothetical protein JO117_11195, partial [Verrucomicrobia bacterium]|nr:hypothetical protein [Verrucomicrobiota bacterium]
MPFARQCRCWQARAIIDNFAPPIDDLHTLPTTTPMLRYFANLSLGRTILWCYLIWYLFFVARYFDDSPKLWLTSLGISGIVGVALILSTTAGAKSRLEPWVTFRLFLMPFCVSSFSALVKGHGFLLVFSPRAQENLVALGLCA